MDRRELERARAKWHYRGDHRPPFAEPPGPGQESVWDYPRPPRIERDSREIIVVACGIEIARTQSAMRVVETASPPTFYLPIGDVRLAVLADAPGGSWCEWKGQAQYLDVCVGGRRIEGAAWRYPRPFPEYAAIAPCLAFYPNKLECFVDGERVRGQPGGLYGGWITAELAGPFKGAPGTAHW